MRFWITLCLLGVARATPAAEAPSPHARAEHVVVVVWDGMRADFATEAHAPNLWQLAQRGVTFRNHHSIYPSLTNVNATALATGRHPHGSGLLANYEFRPTLNAAKFIRTDDDRVIEKGDAASGGHYLTAPTITELLRAKGGSAAIAGAKSVALLHDRNPSPPSVTLFAGAALPPSAQDAIVKLLGPFPAIALPNAAQDRWTTQALTDELWRNGLPQFLLLWLSEPDRAQHYTAPGSKEALAAIKSSDDNLAAVLDALEKKGVRERTDIFVVSDHGFSTIRRIVDLRALLRHADFKVIEDGTVAQKAGEIRVVSDGGTILFYVTAHDPEVVRRLIDWLQHAEFAGVIFSRELAPGTFSFAQAQIDTPAAPDVVLSTRWTDATNKDGVPGTIDVMTSSEPVVATHGSLSKFDLHNILFAAGPDFRAGLNDELPTSNVDVVPTILHILGVPQPQLDGRILREAMVGEANVETPPVSTTLEVAHDFPNETWRQHLRETKFANEVYLDEGNGELGKK